MPPQYHHDKPFLKPQERGRMFQPSHSMTEQNIVVNTGEWEHVIACRFGEGRPCDSLSHTKWTGDCYRYDIFRKVTPPSEVSIPVREGVEPGKITRPGKTQWALRWWNGGGEGWLLCDDRNNGVVQLIAMIAEMPVEERRWDACHFIWESIDKAARIASDETARKYKQAFVDGKLKKRKKRGENTYAVTIEG